MENGDVLAFKQRSYTSDLNLFNYLKDCKSTEWISTFDWCGLCRRSAVFTCHFKKPLVSSYINAIKFAAFLVSVPTKLFPYKPCMVDLLKAKLTLWSQFQKFKVMTIQGGLDIPNNPFPYNKRPPLRDCNAQQISWILHIVDWRDRRQA